MADTQNMPVHKKACHFNYSPFYPAGYGQPASWSSRRIPERKKRRWNSDRLKIAAGRPAETQVVHLLQDEPELFLQVRNQGRAGFRIEVRRLDGVDQIV